MTKIKHLSVGDKFRYIGDLSKTIYTLVSMRPLIVVADNGNPPFLPGIGAYIVRV